MIPTYSTGDFYDPNQTVSIIAAEQHNNTSLWKQFDKQFAQ